MQAPDAVDKIVAYEFSYRQGANNGRLRIESPDYPKMEGLFRAALDLMLGEADLRGTEVLERVKAKASEHGLACGSISYV